jgi:hypothetical protein
MTGSASGKSKDVALAKLRNWFLGVALDRVDIRQHAHITGRERRDGRRADLKIAPLWLKVEELTT